MIWNYFASRHGKGKVDGAGALLNRELSKEQIKPNAKRIQSTQDAVEYLKAEAIKFHATHEGTW